MSEQIRPGDHVAGKANRIGTEATPCLHYFTGVVQDVVTLPETTITTIRMHQAIERKYGNPYMLFHSSTLDPGLTRVDRPADGGVS